MSTKNLIPLEKDKNVKIVAEIYKFAIEKIMKNPRLLEVKTDQSKRKIEDSGNVEYLQPGAMVIRNYLNDREFPLETVNLMTHELNHDEEIGAVKIHTGAYANEYARSMHAMAFTIGATIFFRN